MFIAEADLPWAVAYLHDEHKYAGVPDAIESSDSPLPELVLGLDFISKKSTWVYTFQEEDGEVGVREWVVPRKKMQSGALVPLGAEDYEHEKSRVKKNALKWIESQRLDEEVTPAW